MPRQPGVGQSVVSWASRNAKKRRKIIFQNKKAELNLRTRNLQQGSNSSSWERCARKIALQLILLVRKINSKNLFHDNFCWICMSKRVMIGISG